MTQAVPPVERRAMRTLMLRVVPLLAIGAVFQGFSQTNVSFAGLQMTRDLGFTETQFGFGSGIFFLSYLLLGIPSNLFLIRFGAQRWIAFAMLSWGLLSACLALSSSPGSFYALRLALGAAEAGFIPGILYIAGSWFPDRYRGRVLSLLLVCNPIAIMIGGPLSGFLLSLDGWGGLAGWQWVFILEGLPASLLAFWVLFMLPPRVDAARWLAADERAWLVATLARERSESADPDRFTPAALVDPRVILFALVFLGTSMLPFGLIFFIPKIIEAFGATQVEAAALSALPFATGAVLMLAWGHRSDRTGERLYHALAALAFAIAGCALYLLIGASSAIAGMVGLCMTFGGMFAFLTIFWTMPNRMLKGAVAATGIAIINGMGGVSGIIAPTITGWLKDTTGRYESGTMLAICTASAAGLLLWWFGRRWGLSRPDDHRAAPAAPSLAPAAHD